jgi:hypothetical protein
LETFSSKTHPMTTDKRDAVVEAAKDFCALRIGFVDLQDAVDNLTRSEGVPPEEVEPGTRFRFEDAARRPTAWVGTVIKAGIEHDGDTGDFRRMWMEPNRPYVAFCFSPDDRIIPLEDTQP